MPITTTLNAIRRYKPCKSGWEKLLNHLGKAKADDDPLLISIILASNGLGDAIWCLRAVEDKQAIVEFAQRCANSVKDLIMDAAGAASYAKHAAEYDGAASYAKYASEYAEHAGDVAEYAGYASAYASDAAGAAVYAASAAAAAADAAAGYAAGYDARGARGTEQKKQAQFLIEIFG